VPRMAVERVEDRDGLRVHSLAPRLYRQLAVVMRQDKIVTKGMEISNHDSYGRWWRCCSSDKKRC
ncbi:hypothetical protein ACG0UJ_26415, partial [Klebsiella pneumoniae]